MTPAEAVEAMDQARAALSSGDPRKAFQALRWALEFPSPVSADPALWPPVVNLFAEISEPIAGPELARLLRSVAPGPRRRLWGLWQGAAAPVTAQALFEVGFELIEHQLHGIAATFLALANELEPNQELLTSELAVALEGCGKHDEARRVLEAAAPSLLESSFSCSYLLAFDTLITGDVARARQRFSKLESTDDSQRSMATALDGSRVKSSRFV